MWIVLTESIDLPCSLNGCLTPACFCNLMCSSYEKYWFTISPTTAFPSSVQV